ncbi:hypothetical protein KKF84_21395 [Myxococcota bacterium]|nr:hypothetical protein [Myxococcota bacterium]MBU1537882.1 hypothetical protein [Myxococcota bacterium]
MPSLPDTMPGEREIFTPDPATMTLYREIHHDPSTVITRRSHVKDRIKVILVGEDLGY